MYWQKSGWLMCLILAVSLFVVGCGSDSGSTDTQSVASEKSGGTTDYGEDSEPMGSDASYDPTAAAAAAAQAAAVAAAGGEPNRGASSGSADLPPPGSSAFGSGPSP